MPLEQEPKGESNDNFELESQFLLRLPSLPAASLRAALKSGVLNLKDRLTIQIDQEIRTGMVRFDGWVLAAKIVDLPAIIESHKTLDNKNFYKTADIAQLMICKEEEIDEEKKEEIEETIKKSKDGKDKKFLYPHGVTKPLKNVRKRRFRKTLKKKYVDFPEIEKEVKRLLRTDNEAKNVRYEIVNADDVDNKHSSKDKDHLTANAYDEGILFGDVVSSSDEDDEDALMQSFYSDEGSRASVSFKDYLKEDFNQSNFTNTANLNFSTNFTEALKTDQINLIQPSSSSSFQNLESFVEVDENNKASSNLVENLNMENENIKMKLLELESEIHSLQTQQIAQQIELDSIENLALKQRFQANIDDLNNQEALKKKEYDELKRSLS